MKLVVVTGGSAGIGRAITERLISDGYKVYFTYHKSKESAAELEAKFSGQCKGFCLDGSKEGEVNSFADTVLSEEVPYAIINNIGINDDKLFLNQTLDDFWAQLKINFGSTLNFCKAFLTSMLERRHGHIINISSVAANKPKPGNAAYGVSKSSIERFSKTLALEVARFGIYVNCISPGFVKTNMVDKFLSSGDKRKFFLNIPMKKILSAKNIADVASSILSGNIVTTGSVLSLGNGENIT